VTNSFRLAGATEEDKPSNRIRLRLTNENRLASAVDQSPSGPDRIEIDSNATAAVESTQFGSAREELRTHDHFYPHTIAALRRRPRCRRSDAATVAGALDSLTRRIPTCASTCSPAKGKLRAFVNLYLNDEDVRYLPAKEATAVTAADTLSIIPSIAGGALAGTGGRRAFGAVHPATSPGAN
jgi:molybdopterin synthase sulfur carrier subunit